MKRSSDRASSKASTFCERLAIASASASASLLVSGAPDQSDNIRSSKSFFADKVLRYDYASHSGSVARCPSSITAMCLRNHLPWVHSIEIHVSIINRTIFGLVRLNDASTEYVAYRPRSKRFSRVVERGHDRTVVPCLEVFTHQRQASSTKIDQVRDVAHLLQRKIAQAPPAHVA